MAKSQEPMKNQKELVTWAFILAILLLVAGGILLKIRSAPESNVHIPETAFEKKPPRSRPLDSPSETSSSVSHPSDSSTIREPTPASTVVQRAMELVDQGHWEQAEPILLAELQRNPKDEAVLL